MVTRLTRIEILSPIIQIRIQAQMTRTDRHIYTYTYSRKDTDGLDKDRHTDNKDGNM